MDGEEGAAPSSGAGAGGCLVARDDPHGFCMQLVARQRLTLGGNRATLHENAMRHLSRGSHIWRDWWPIRLERPFW